MAHQDFQNAVDKPIDLAEAVRKYRANEVATRRVAFRNGGTNWSSSRGTAAINSRQQVAQEIKLALTLAGHERLAQALTDEAVAFWLIRCAEIEGKTAEQHYDALFAAKRAIRRLAGI